MMIFGWTLVKGRVHFFAAICCRWLLLCYAQIGFTVAL